MAQHPLHERRKHKACERMRKELPAQPAHAMAAAEGMVAKIMKMCKKCGRLPDLWKMDGQKIIGCLGCGIKIPFQGDVKEAIEKWDEMQEEREEK